MLLSQRVKFFSICVGSVAAWQHGMGHETLHRISMSKEVVLATELFLTFFLAVAFRIYDMDKDGYISNGELFQVLKMMVGNNLKDTQLQQIVDKTIINADKDGDGRISFEEFCAVSIYFK